MTMRKSSWSCWLAIAVVWGALLPVLYSPKVRQQKFFPCA